MTYPGSTLAANRETALFREVLTQASQGGSELMGKLVMATRRSLSEREEKSRDLHARDKLIESRKLLDQLAEKLRSTYPTALEKAFSEDGKSIKSLPSGVALGAKFSFDQLELMDEVQVDESVQLARSQQVVLLGADAAMADINALICAAQGLKTVRAESNPIRPSNYVAALLACLTQLQVPPLIRQDWMPVMCAELGPELSKFYSGMTQRLRTQGVVAAGYAVIRTAAAPPSRGASREASLTLDKLRRLLSGELDTQEQALLARDAGGQGASTGSQSFAERFSREFEQNEQTPAGNDFHPTVPAAFEALTEMRQVDQVMKQIQNRKGAAPLADANVTGGPDAVRHQLMAMARGLGQTLSLEVVGLMVQNIAGDKRLLEPIAQVVRNMEPALLRLALVDPRFFSDKQHPARRLLDEITSRSLAFDSAQARGFASFFNPLKEGVDPLAHQPIDNAEPFEMVLSALIEVWDENALRDKQQLEKAMSALRHAEARNLQAEKVAAEIRARPDAVRVDEDVMNFLCSPWAQVVAQARLSDTASSADPGQFLELISMLMWSAQPDLTRKNIAELTRLVPKLLAKLREGLETISYPSVKTSAFFEALMNLHQQAFKPANLTTPVVKTAAMPMDSTKSQLLADDADPWVAPVEAKMSGFMEIPAIDRKSPVPTAPQADMLNLDELLNAVAPPVDAELPIGTWVELQVNGQWARTQLSWASPHGTLFLFTSAFGSTQSMSLRTRNKMLAAGTLRVISSQHLVDGALDAVAQTALLNSVEQNPDAATRH
jgi:hypothetical protein